METLYPINKYKLTLEQVLNDDEFKLTNKVGKKPKRVKSLKKKVRRK